MSPLAFVVVVILLCHARYVAVESSSKYVIDDNVYSHPLPLDVCLLIENHSILYSCINNSNIVYKLNFTNTTSCALSNPMITPLDNLVSSQFSCTGQTSYIVEQYYQTEQDCNNVIHTNNTKAVHIAMDVCFFDPLYQKYGTYSCTALFQRIVYFSDYNACVHHDDYDDYVSNITLSPLSSSSLCNPHSNIAHYPYHSLSKCVINNLIETPDDYTINVSNNSFSIYHRIALIDFYIATTEYGHVLWDTTCRNTYYPGTYVGITRWNLFALALDGDIWFYNESYPFCGLDVVYFDANTLDPIEYVDIITGDNALTGTLPSTLCFLGDRLLTLRIIFAPSLYGTIPECYGTDFYFMDSIALSYTSITGNIPPYIGYLPYFSQLMILDNPLMNTTLPESLCIMIDNPYYADIWISNVPVHGAIPDCSISSEHGSSFKWITFEGTNINGTIPLSFCNISQHHYFKLQLMQNPNIHGQIPSCLTPPELEIREMSGLSGTVPGDLFCTDILGALIFENNTNFDPSTVPECLSDDKPDLKYLILYNSSFIGTLPPLPSNSSLKWINIAYNQFEGSLSDIVHYDIDNVRYFIAHKNNFHDENITELLNYFLMQTNITILSISDNADISGSIPNHVNDSDLSIFLAHNCDLHGTLPTDFYFESLSIISLYGNRLSGTLPMDIGANVSQLSTMVLLDNLFFAQDFELPSWVNSPFSTAPNLYVSKYKQDLSIFVLSMSGLAATVILIDQIMDSVRKYMKHSVLLNVKPAHAADEFGFFENIEFIKHRFNDWKLLLCVALLITVYAFNTNYYSVVTFESYFALSWYHSDGSYSWTHWCLLILAVSIQIIISKIILDLNLEQIHIKHKKTLKEMSIASKQERKKTQQLDIYENYVFDKQISTNNADTNSNDTSTNIADTNINDNAINTNSNNRFVQKTRYSHILYALWVMVYCVLYLVGISFVVMYWVARSLPEQNVLHLRQSESILITQSIGLILFINNEFIIKGLVGLVAKHYDFVYFYRSEFELGLRINNSIIVPLISSIILLNDCGKYWIHLWDYCNNEELRQEFDFWATVGYDACEEQECDTNIMLLSAHEVCSKPSIDVNKCIRSFFYHWTFAIMMKLIFTMIASIFGLLWKSITRRCCKRIYIEGHYTTIITNLLISIIFLFISPLILLLNLMQISLRTYLYRVYVFKFKMQLSIKNTRNVKAHKTKQSLPIYFLWIGVIIGHILVIVFLVFSIQNVIIVAVFALSVVVMGVYCRFMVQKSKKHFAVIIESEKEKETRSRSTTADANVHPDSSPDLVSPAVACTMSFGPLSKIIFDVEDKVQPNIEVQLADLIVETDAQNPKEPKEPNASTLSVIKYI
eukprot:23053_1